jgi:geranylgeranyl pyrophosphate synthase
MEILPIYSNQQMEKCKKAGLDPSMIYLLDSSKDKRFSEEKWGQLKFDYLNGLKGLIPFLKSVEETKLLIEPEMYRNEENIKQSITNYTNNNSIGEVVSRAIRSPSWRERATIINLITKMFGGNLDRQYVQTATAIELVQEAFMLQDDILDGQERCVNRETIPTLYGISRTNLAKDLLLAKAGDDLRENLESRIMAKGLGLVEEMIKNDTLGQWIDMENERRPNISEEEYFQMIKLTPGTQFQNIAHLAYLLTGKNNKKIINHLREYGLNLGMAAQLRDDVIDIIGDEEIVYKKLGTDILRRKKRLPLIKYLEENPKDKNLFETEEIKEKELEKVLERIRDSKAINYSINRVRNLIDYSIFYLHKLQETPERKILEDTASLVANFD